jgi:excisionase family DNA binding protein
MPANILEDYIDIAPLADELGLHPRTLMRWTEQPHGLPFVRLGRRILFKRDSVRDWISAHEHKPRGATRRRQASQADAIT